MHRQATGSGLEPVDLDQIREMTRGRMDTMESDELVAISEKCIKGKIKLVIIKKTI